MQNELSRWLIPVDLGRKMICARPSQILTARPKPRTSPPSKWAPKKKKVVHHLGSLIMVHLALYGCYSWCTNCGGLGALGASFLAQIEDQGNGPCTGPPNGAQGLPAVRNPSSWCTGAVGGEVKWCTGPLLCNWPGRGKVHLLPFAVGGDLVHRSGWR